MASAAPQVYMRYAMEIGQHVRECIFVRMPILHFHALCEKTVGRLPRLCLLTLEAVLPKRKWLCIDYEVNMLWCAYGVIKG